MIEYFTSKTEVMPLSAAPEPKRRFVPSKHEAKRVMKIVRAIREGRIVPNKPKVEEPEFFDLWADNAPPKPDHIMNIPAPKLPPPQHDESYNPPKEYLLNEQERKEWEETEPEDRRRDYMPASYSALRLVPGYEKNIKERFERCLDLYLAPRVRRKKLNIDPESLLPKLPSPQDLRPFPTSCATLYKGHEGRVRTVDIDPTGAWLATGGDDGTVRVWEILTGRQLWKMSIGDGKEAVNSIKWRPGTEAVVLAAAAGDEIHLLVPPIFDPEIEQAGREVLAAGWGYAKTNDSINAEKKENAAAWTKPARALEDAGVSVIISLKHTIKHLAWHRRGDYLASVAPEGQNRAVAIHQLTKHHSQHPFRKSKGIIQRVEFHPFKPILFVATQRYIRVYDLSKQDLIKTLQTGARWISSFDVHPGGDNVLVGTYDKRLLWHDLDLSLTPYKTMRYHDKAIRSVAYHQGGLPLFCSSSDDGTIQVFHGRVVTDLLENALIVPLKILRGHKVKDSLGVLDTVWHPKQPWLFSAGADGVARMWF